MLGSMALVHQPSGPLGSMAEVPQARQRADQGAIGRHKPVIQRLRSHDLSKSPPPANQAVGRASIVTAPHIHNGHTLAPPAARSSHAFGERFHTTRSYPARIRLRACKGMKWVQVIMQAAWPATDRPRFGNASDCTLWLPRHGRGPGLHSMSPAPRSPSHAPVHPTMGLPMMPSPRNPMRTSAASARCSAHVDRDRERQGRARRGMGPRHGARRRSPGRHPACTPTVMSDRRHNTASQIGVQGHCRANGAIRSWLPCSHQGCGPRWSQEQATPLATACALEHRISRHRPTLQCDRCGVQCLQAQLKQAPSNERRGLWLIPLQPGDFIQK